MARHAETPSFNNPWERIVHTAHGIPTWAGRHKGRLALATIATLSAAAIVFRPEDRSDTGIQPASGVSDTFNRPDSGLGAIIPTIPTETPPPTATAEPTKTPTPEVVKPMPRIISLETLKKASRGTVVWGPEQIEDERAKVAEGDYRIPLPQNILDLGGSMAISNKDPYKERWVAFAIPDKFLNADITFPALIGGKVTDARKANARMNIISIQDNSGYKLDFAFSITGSTILVTAGDIVQADTPVFTVRHDQTFAEDRQEKFEDPPNTIAGMQVSNPNGSVTNLHTNRILTDDAGNVVTVALPGK